MRLKIKGVGLDGPYIPDSGSRNITPIKYTMSNVRKEKMDINDIEYELGDDRKNDRSEVRDNNPPKPRIDMASDVIPLPEDLEPTSKRRMKTQHVKPDVGVETQIKIRSFGSKSRRKTSVAPATKLGDTSHREIVAPKVVDTKRVPVQGPKVDISDMQDVQIQGKPVTNLRSKVVTHFDKHVQIHVDQTIQAPHNPLRVKKVSQSVTFAESSGFRTEFNPCILSHRNKLKQAVEHYRVIIDQDPEVTLAVMSRLDFKDKRDVNTSFIQPQQDDQNLELRGQTQRKNVKKSSIGHQDISTFEDMEVRSTSKSRHKHHNSKVSQVDTHENVDVITRESKSRHKHRNSATPQVESHEDVEVSDRRSKKSSKNRVSKVQPHDEDDEHIEVRDTRKGRTLKDNVATNIEIPEDGKFISLGVVKGASKGKKTGTRLAVNVSPFEGEVTISAKPSDMAEKKGKADPSGLEQSPTGDEVQVESKMKSKRVKQPESLDLQLGSTDKDTDSDIAAPHQKERQAKAALPNFDPSLDDQDVEIEKTKNVLIFT